MLAEFCRQCFQQSVKLCRLKIVFTYGKRLFFTIRVNEIKCRERGNIKTRQIKKRWNNKTEIEEGGNKWNKR